MKWKTLSISVEANKVIEEVAKELDLPKTKVVELSVILVRELINGKRFPDDLGYIVFSSQNPRLVDFMKRILEARMSKS